MFRYILGILTGILGVLAWAECTEDVKTEPTLRTQDCQLPKFSASDIVSHRVLIMREDLLRKIIDGGAVAGLPENKFTEHAFRDLARLDRLFYGNGDNDRHDELRGECLRILRPDEG